jgi:membrane protease YdiL (CAAX protease family)
MNPLLNPTNHLFNLARSGQRLPHIVLAVVLGFVFVFVAQLGGGIPAAVIVIGLSAAGGEDVSFDDPTALIELVQPDTALEQTIFLILAFGPIFLILWGWLALFEKRPLWTIGLERAGAGLKYGRGFIIGLVMFAVSIGISAAFGYLAFETGGAGGSQGLAALGGVLLVYLGWTVQGPAEEALTRGWLLPTVGARYKPWLGVLISSGIFTVLHLLNPNVGPVAVLNLFLFGVFAALYALYEGGLWGVFSLHVAWNWAQGNLFGFEVSGGLPPGGALFDLMEVGPDLVTGGPFGPEGGLAVTAVLLVSCGVVWVLGRRKDVR